MKLFQYNVYTPETFNASGKAKKDVSAILSELGIGDIYHPSRHRALRILQQTVATTRPYADTAVFVQYPAVVDTFIRRLHKKKKLCLIGIIHDLSSVRGERTPESEIEILNYFDCLISHNPSMTLFLKENGYRGKVIDLGIFDYLLDASRPVKPAVYSNEIAFAGNLDKSIFLKEIESVSSLKFLLYGVNNQHEIEKYANVDYRGMLPSDEIPFLLEGSFGLVWDGETVQTCEGILGRYLKFNNPHKLSLYIVSERPVIVWSQSAVAPFVREHGIGLTVDSLFQAQEQIAALTPARYDEYLANVRSVKSALASGEFMKAAIRKSVEEVSK